MSSERGIGKPNAIVNGEVLQQLPADLYIPPQALQVFLEAFEGPLDLLLYLIKKQNLDIVNIPIAEVTHQYVEYIALMQELQLELAADYLVMAATLAEIKSRLLLPRQTISSDEEEDLDPRAELIKRLQEYECFKTAAQQLDDLPRQGRDLYAVSANTPNWQLERVAPTVSFRELLAAMQEVLVREQISESHHIEREQLSVRERMTAVLTQLDNTTFTDFRQLLQQQQGRAAAIVTFLAILELAKESMIEIVQADLFAAIHLRAVS